MKNESFDGKLAVKAINLRLLLRSMKIEIRECKPYVVRNVSNYEGVFALDVPENMEVHIRKYLQEVAEHYPGAKPQGDTITRIYPDKVNCVTLHFYSSNVPESVDIYSDLVSAMDEFDVWLEQKNVVLRAQI